MPAAATDSPQFLEQPPAGWWFCGWASTRVAAGITDRRIDCAALAPYGQPVDRLVEAEQVHGSSVAVVERVKDATGPIAGCDALLTRTPGLALAVRTADCLPMFFCDPARDVVGIAHAGWRGLAASLPARVITALRHAYQARAEDLHVAIGPAIRACCYEVGQEVAARFGPFVREHHGRRTCDLIGLAVDQLTRCGISPERIVDSGRCTSCEADRWFSLRREGPSTGRLTSLIMLRP